jgi:dienelactone hydrolase
MERVVEIGGLRLAGDLFLPREGRAVVVFAHGSGSSRRSPRNRFVAAGLNRRGFATLLMDLLTPDEDRNFERRFYIGLLDSRLTQTLDWLARLPDVAGLPVMLFGASTGAAAALDAAVLRPHMVKAVVSRGGRPDLAVQDLSTLTAPVLLIVGGDDTEVTRLNRLAMRRMPAASTRIEVIPGATHLFEEPGALESVERLAGAFLEEQL